MKDCPDCKGSLSPIKLLDSTAQSMSGEGAQQVPLRYAEAGAGRSFLFGQYDDAGAVHAYLCSDCKRIFLYGE